jgi:hypothetical protein
MPNRALKNSEFFDFFGEPLFRRPSSTVALFPIVAVVWPILSLGSCHGWLMVVSVAAHFFIVGLLVLLR